MQSGLLSPARPCLSIPLSLVPGLGTHGDHGMSISLGLACDTVKATGCSVHHLPVSLSETFQQGISVTPEASASGCRWTWLYWRLLPTGCSAGSALGEAMTGVRRCCIQGGHRFPAGNRAGR